VATMITNLCGPHSDFVTGQTIHVNGGSYFP
jgi:NAD(P)-dependent dehydrogenase (short-subunit alcohol dehydrogenase family)